MFPDAQCAGFAFPDLFFPDTAADLKLIAPMLKRTCQSCIHQVACLAFAIDNNIKEGIWGGLTPDERKQEKAFKHNSTKIKGTK